ncbi:MAG: hypothetical protein R2746_15170 [Acidimicrobiales bacterium]
MQRVPPWAWAVAVIAALGAAGAVAAGTHPVGTRAADAVAAAVVGAVVVLLASRAHWHTLLLGAAMVVAAGSTPQRVAALAVAVAVTLAGPREQLGPVASAGAALVVLQCCASPPVPRRASRLRWRRSP